MKKVLKKSNNPNGRPKSASPKTANLGCVRLTQEELAALKAQASGVFSQWVRSRLGIENT